VTTASKSQATEPKPDETSRLTQPASKSHVTELKPEETSRLTQSESVIRGCLTTSGKPKVVQDAIQLYEQRKYRRAYETLIVYIRDIEEQGTAKYLARGANGIRPSDLPDPEAYLLKGILELYQEDKKLGYEVAVHSAPKSFGGGNLDKAKKSFASAIELDSKYRDKICVVIKQLCLDLMSCINFSVDDPVARTLAKARQHIKNREFKSAGKAISGVWEADDDALISVRDSIELLRAFDRKAAKELSKNLATQTKQKQIPADQREQAVFFLWCQLLPELVSAMKQRKEDDFVPVTVPDNDHKEHLVNGRFVDESRLPLDCIKPTFSGKTLPNGAVEFYSELLRQSMVGVKPSKKYIVSISNPYAGVYFDTTKIMESRLPLVHAAIAHPAELLPQLLEASKKDSSLAIASQWKADNVFHAAAWNAFVERFCEVVIDHAANHRESDYMKFCMTAWPPISINEIARMLICDRGLLKNEQFFFAFAWHDAHSPVRSVDFGLFSEGGYKLADYERKWPQGRYIHLCKQRQSPVRPQSNR